MNRFFAFLTPLFSGLLPLLYLFHNNPGEVWVFDFLILSFCVSVVILIIFAIFYCIRRKFYRSSFATLISLLPLSVMNETYSTQIQWIVWLTCLAISIIFLFLPMKEKVLKKIMPGFFVPLTILSLFFVFSITKSRVCIAQAESTLQAKQEKEFSFLKQSQNLQKKGDFDVYVFILDELISPVAFREYYHYDNENFFYFLKSEKFHIIDHSYSNYPWTIPSISSMVSLNYHKNWVKKKEFPSIGHLLLRQNMISKLLESDGYHVHRIPSIYWFGNPSRGLWHDFFFRAKSYGLTLSVLRSTFLNSWARKYQRTEHQNHILHQFVELERLITSKEKKKFVFTHFLCPHRPIVFDREGNQLQGNDVDLSEKDKEHKYYLDQAYFICQEVQKTVTQILACSSKPPLIIILSDHGKFPLGVSGKGMKSLPLDQISWRFSNLMAVHLPDDMPMPKLLTPINLFRMILHGYYGYDLPLLDDLCCPDFYDLEIQENAAHLVPFQAKKKAL